MKLQITIEGRAWEVEVELMEEEEAPPQLAPPALAHYAPGPSFHNSDPDICRSPVNGLVIRVDVAPGDTVEPNQVMVVLEAMKMETNVTAPRAAIVKAVHAVPGGPVKLNQPLIEFE